MCQSPGRCLQHLPTTAYRLWSGDTAPAPGHGSQSGVLEADRELPDGRSAINFPARWPILSKLGWSLSTEVAHSAFAGFTLLLMCVGLYSVAASSASRPTNVRPQTRVLGVRGRNLLKRMHEIRDSARGEVAHGSCGSRAQGEARSRMSANPVKCSIGRWLADIR